MSCTVFRRALWVLVPVCLPALAGTDTLPEGLRHCTSETDATKRLACFDALASSLPKIEADRFGMTAEIAQKREPAQKRPRLSSDEVLTGKIRALREAPRGQLVFTLDNDQVWIQAEPSPSIQFHVGESVRIEHGAMSSLWLVAEHRKTRVKRLS